MKQIKYFCDKCKKEIEGAPIKINPRWHTPESAGKQFVYDNSDEKDFCVECSDEIYEFMMKPPKHKKVIEESKEEKVKGAAKNIDIGKVQALRNAGWTLEKIADEVGVSVSTIYNMLKK
jgi:hypothetical protein